MLEGPLVSIVVVTYNSAATILESLESFKSQTYNNLELIISDDCSRDKTLVLCREWIETNRESFALVKLLTSEKNTGVCANLNRGVRASNGVYIKTIAGDDILENHAISTFVDEASSGHYDLLCSRTVSFPESDRAKRNQSFMNDNQYYWLSKAPDELYRYSLVRHILPGPSIFYSRDLYERIGGFDERFPMTEEWPFEIKAFKVANFHFINETLVKYRISGESASTKRYKFGDGPINYANREIFFKIRRHLLKEEHLYLYLWHETLKYYIMKSVCDKGGEWKRIFMVLSPVWWLRGLKILKL